MAGSAAAQLPAGPTVHTGALGGRNFYRTPFATQTVASTCRSKAVAQGFYDSAANKTYHVYSAGIDGPSPYPGVSYSAVNPTIVAFDHDTRTWEGPVQLENVRALTPIPATRDCHNYPQVVVDKYGYLHVFHTFHNTDIDIRHYRSNAPHSITSGWSADGIPGTKDNTYGGAFVANDGDIYVFFRASLDSGAGGGWYEPEMFVKTSTAGKGWDAPRKVIDPGRSPSAVPGSPAYQETSIINESLWRTIYVEDMQQDRANNRIAIEFGAHIRDGQWWGHRYFVWFDMDDDKLYTASGALLGDVLARPAYTTGACCTVYAPAAPLSGTLMGDKLRALSHAIVLENSVPTLYYAIFESTATGVGSDQKAYYDQGWDRLKKAEWNGSAWAISYVGGTADPSLDPFIGTDTEGHRVGVHSVVDAEYRQGTGTDLYVKTKWGGVRFWEYAPNQPRPEYVKLEPKYQFPLRVFNSVQGWNTSTRVFGDHPEWEVRGVANFSLIPNAHPSMRAYVKVPKYSGDAVPSATDFANQFAIGADYVFGESVP